MMRRCLALTSAIGAVQAAPSEYPSKVLGMYVLIADDTEKYQSNTIWEPVLPAYMDTANVLWLAFVNPTAMPSLPPAMAKLAQAHPEKPVIAAISGQLYSKTPNPWPFLTSVEAAESMAVEVAKWADLGIDGVDLDIEDGAGDDARSGPNMWAFVKKLQQLAPGFIVTQPVYGYPGIGAENYIVNNGFVQQPEAKISSVGIMYYRKAQALNYVDRYVHATSQSSGFPIHVDVPSQKVLLGADGKVDSGSLTTLAKAVHDQNLGGIMVWYASVKDKATGSTAIADKGDGDASTRTDSSEWARALSIMQGAQANQPVV